VFGKEAIRMRILLVFLLVSLAILAAVSQIANAPAYHATTVADNQHDSFVVPIKIDTYGDAWSGYLAFGLWQFNSTDLSPLHSFLVVMNSKGQLLDIRRSNDIPTYWPVKYISPNTLMFMGEPDSLATHFWNMKTNKSTDFANVWGHHDIVFNPFTKTFLTLRDYVRVIDGRNVLMDKIVELNAAGDVLWSWDTYSDGHFGLNDECPCNDTTGPSSGYLPAQTLIDLTHSNSLQWVFNENIIYINMRALNTFCKINKTSSQTIWCLGEHGNFDLYDANGNRVTGLWFHSHDVKEVQPGIFSMFDNDYHNTTMPCRQALNGTMSHSRMLEIAVNEQNMTARVSWSWTAPSAYWTPYWGKVDRLTNGDRIGTFGSQSHYVSNSSGAVLVEVNPKGGLVRSYTFPYGWGIYRIEEINLQTLNDYDGKWHSNNLSITLTTTNALGGPTDIFYRINNDSIQSVNNDGQPRITTPGGNNTLEYWSIDKAGIEETPHRILTGIKLNESSTANSAFTANEQQIGYTIVISLMVVMVAVVLGLRRMREHQHPKLNVQL
jgi:hypothetical protein